MVRIQYQRGDIFDSKAQVIVNTVNCKGVMGKGLALSFKERYPDMFRVYQEECRTGKLRIGRPTLYKASTPWILNFPTKDHWRFPSKPEYLEKGLEYLVAHYKQAGITSIAFPKLGAQNGKLSWDEVGPLMAKYLSQLDIDVYIYITEDDTEYQYDEDSEKNIWKRFSELALSQDSLCQEVQLSPREAKKVLEVRESMEFTSQADIDMIDGLAKNSSKKIKEYIRDQRFTRPELPGMDSKKFTYQPLKKKRNSTPRKKRSKNQTTKAETPEDLFSGSGAVSD
jgi:O-acetyl-ADP-ribose deacetylase (regulator of RNase III)